MKRGFTRGSMMTSSTWIKIKGYLQYHITCIIDSKLVLITVILWIMMGIGGGLTALSLKSNDYDLNQYQAYETTMLTILTFSGVGLGSYLFIDSFSPEKDMGRYLIIPIDTQFKPDTLRYISLRLLVIMGYLALYMLGAGEMSVFAMGSLHLNYVSTAGILCGVESYILTVMYGFIGLIGYDIVHHKLWSMGPIIIFLVRYLFSDYLFLIKLGSLEQGLNYYDVLLLMMIGMISFGLECQKEHNW